MMQKGDDQVKSDDPNIVLMLFAQDIAKLAFKLKLMGCNESADYIRGYLLLLSSGRLKEVLNFINPIVEVERKRHNEINSNPALSLEEKALLCVNRYNENRNKTDKPESEFQFSEIDLDIKM